MIQREAVKCKFITQMEEEIAEHESIMAILRETLISGSHSNTEIDIRELEIMNRGKQIIDLREKIAKMMASCALNHTDKDATKTVESCQSTALDSMFDIAE